MARHRRPEDLKVGSCAKLLEAGPGRRALAVGAVLVTERPVGLGQQYARTAQLIGGIELLPQGDGGPQGGQGDDGLAAGQGRRASGSVADGPQTVAVEAVCGLDDRRR